MSKYNRFEKDRLKAQEERKTKRARKKLYLKMSILVILLSIIVSVGVFGLMNDLGISDKQELLVEQKLNFLILGSDALNQGINRADSIMVASVDLKDGQIGILSLPRDTRVQIPGKEGYHKLNAAYAYGGSELIKETVEKLIKVPIDYSISTDFNGFKSIINTLGGIEVNVAKDLKYIDQAGGLYIDIPAGNQTLYGQQALEYIRFRHDRLGDIGRIRRQQKFIKAVMDKILTPKVIFKIPKLIKQLSDNIETDLPMTKGLKLAMELTDEIRDFNRSKIKMETLPGTPKYADGISYWVPDKAKLEAVTSSLIRSKDYLNNSQLNVMVLNGNGKVGLANEIGDLLSQSGYNIIKVGNAKRFDYSKTKVIYKSSAKQNAEKMANYLHGELEVWQEVEEKNKNEVDIKVILGENIN
ncbi:MULTISPECIES: LCP family protein [unclassified Candidatus Frackibacter]|uniref:LCP family protein n=1 Tax=unclassified Candidatus Frackibacter TaxID=2648818 RepID=UPI000891BD0B|nr:MULTISPECIES: LCP family protein [unclassified Candidatus Frackibacter]SDC39761.1 cell envelope-related function transcriptional attenuator common domain-containing protein [Candidatus Frackibacter sp. WG11]SEM60942.1 cell envelope-related function transcriptional attenuator common domain-containing protein [Candidatus Frackibacter sp. WG12]SFL60976.1 cell envelope-related function transcriptional attenuator common domain-containing protein [Candidatus Frackibacter sp. WG13]